MASLYSLTVKPWNEVEIEQKLIFQIAKVQNSYGSYQFVDKHPITADFLHNTTQLEGQEARKPQQTSYFSSLDYYYTANHSSQIPLHTQPYLIPTYQDDVSSTSVTPAASHATLSLSIVSGFILLAVSTASFSNAGTIIAFLPNISRTSRTTSTGDQ